ncbi:hypothetical protein R6G99_09820, partial [Actinotignum timonense]|nr:hypothetical protein [Actinotignum timonense]
MHAGPVLVIGSGLLGASLGLRLRLRDIPVYLEDSSPLAPVHLAPITDVNTISQVTITNTL